MQVPIVVTRDKPPPHVGLHFLPHLNKPLMVSPPVHHKLIPQYDSIVSELSDNEFYLFLLGVAVALKNQLHLLLSFQVGFRIVYPLERWYLHFDVS